MSVFRAVRGKLGRATLPAAIIVVAASTSAMAVTDHSGSTIDHLAQVLLALVVILAAAKLGGELFVRIGQPAVLGEITLGIIVGNLSLFGINGLDFVRTDETVLILAEIGVILLLFQVGLESDLAKMIKVGSSSLLVATLGVVAPFLLGYGVATLMLPHESVYVHAFIGATLCATSVGITARVLMDLGRIQTAESRIILGAAVIDDVQGLIILAVVTGIIEAAGRGSAVSGGSIALIIIKATAFLVGAIFIGRMIAPRVFKFASRFRAADILLTASLGVCFLLAYLAKAIDLAAIVGAFAAGLILDEVHWRAFTERGEHSVEELVRPLVGFLAPVFFVYTGAQVDLTAFANPKALGFAAAITIVAIIGKQVCSLGVLQKGLDRLSVGIGMIPRGEVGLIFAGIGSKLVLDGQPLISQSTFAAVIIMVMVTTVVTPPALKWSLGRSDGKRAVMTIREEDSQ